MRLRQLLHRQRHVTRPDAGVGRRQLTFVRVADNHARRGQWNFVGEAVHVAPVDRQQQVERITERANGTIGQSHQRGGLAATNLRPAGAHHQSVTPARAAAASSSVPAVITPLPPLPASAIAAPACALPTLIAEPVLPLIAPSTGFEPLHPFMWPPWFDPDH
jgi:hypothetical protein